MARSAKKTTSKKKYPKAIDNIEIIPTMEVLEVGDFIAESYPKKYINRKTDNLCFMSWLTMLRFARWLFICESKQDEKNLKKTMDYQDWFIDLI